MKEKSCGEVNIYLRRDTVRLIPNRDVMYIPRNPALLICYRHLFGLERSCARDAACLSLRIRFGNLERATIATRYVMVTI